MATYASLRTSAVVFEPVASTAVPANSMYSDAAVPTSSISIKDETSTTAPVSTGQVETSLFTKMMQAGVAPIAINTPVSKNADGKIIPLDRDNPLAEKPIGFTMQAVVNVDDIVAVFTSGPNLPGVLTGKGFTPGDAIYSDNVPGGMVNDISSLNVLTDSILRLGTADCAAGVASSAATDLILSMEVISLPSGG